MPQNEQTSALQELLYKHREIEADKEAEFIASQTSDMSDQTRQILQTLSARIKQKKLDLRLRKLEVFRARKAPIPSGNTTAKVLWDCKCGARYGACRVCCAMCGAFAPYWSQDKSLHEHP